MISSHVWPTLIQHHSEHNNKMNEAGCFVQKLTPSPSFMKSFLQMCAMMPVASASPMTLTMVRNLSLRRRTAGEREGERVQEHWNIDGRMQGRRQRSMITLDCAHVLLTMPNLLQLWEWCHQSATRRTLALSPWWPVQLVVSLLLRCWLQWLWCWWRCRRWCQWICRNIKQHKVSHQQLFRLYMKFYTWSRKCIGPPSSSHRCLIELPWFPCGQQQTA